MKRFKEKDLKAGQAHSMGIEPWKITRTKEGYDLTKLVIATTNGFVFFM